MQRTVLNLFTFDKCSLINYDKPSNFYTQDAATNHIQSNSLLLWCLHSSGGETIKRYILNQERKCAMNKKKVGC